jgi:hypothetical protein
VRLTISFIKKCGELCTDYLNFSILFRERVFLQCGCVKEKRLVNSKRLWQYQILTLSARPLPPSFLACVIRGRAILPGYGDYQRYNLQSAPEV